MWKRFQSGLIIDLERTGIGYIGLILLGSLVLILNAILLVDRFYDRYSISDSLLFRLFGFGAAIALSIFIQLGIAIIGALLMGQLLS